MRQERQYIWKDGKRLSLGRKMAVMGILNVTPDSFSDGGKWNAPEKAACHVRDMIRSGADLIDVGAESSRPGSVPLTGREETERLMAFLPAVLSISAVPVSVDTYHWETAEEAARRGAHIINDIWGFQYDQGEMAEVVSDAALPCVLMHHHEGHVYEGELLDEVKTFLARSVEIALSHGVREDRIILDPGIGFGKTGEQNLYLLRRLDALTAAFPYPFLLGASRKRFIGTILGGAAPEERDLGTAALSFWAFLKGCAMVRVHNVKATAQVLRMGEALAEEPGAV